jgi:hypothetical protein
MVRALAGLAVASLLPFPAATQSPLDACALLSREEVSAALGVEVDPGEHLVPTETRFCMWREHGRDQMQARNVRVSVLSQRDFNGARPSSLLPISTPESGIGDEAYFSKVRGMIFLLSVRKGDSYFRIQARSNPGSPDRVNMSAADRRDQEIDRAIARALLAKL